MWFLKRCGCCRSGIHQPLHSSLIFLQHTGFTHSLVYLQHWTTFFFFFATNKICLVSFCVISHRLSCYRPHFLIGQQWETARWLPLHSAGSVLRRHKEKINQYLTVQSQCFLASCRLIMFEYKSERSAFGVKQIFLSILEFFNFINKEQVRKSVYISIHLRICCRYFKHTGQYTLCCCNKNKLIELSSIKRYLVDFFTTSNAAEQCF